MWFSCFVVFEWRGITMLTMRASAAFAMPSVPKERT